MERPDHVLVVDDDAEIRKLLGEYLQRNGFRVSLANDGREMRRSLEQTRPDIVVLDLMLPGDSGLALCRDLRAGSNLPVIMLTARADEVDRIVGLEMGADDYLGKPFSPRELLARIKSILRRYRSLPRSLRADDARKIAFAGWRLDMAARHLVSPAGVATSLSGGEFQLLKIFLSHPNHVLSRDQLMVLAKGREADPADRTIDIQVSRLRHRLDDDPADPKIIKTVRGEGYVLAATVELEP